MSQIDCESGSIVRDLGSSDSANALTCGNADDLPSDVRTAIHECALELIATESRCVEWGAPARRSVELAEDAILQIVRFALSSSYVRDREHFDVQSAPDNSSNDERLTPGT